MKLPFLLLTLSLFTALCAGCAHVSDYDRIVANEALPAQVRLAVSREPEARKLFQMLRDDCRMFATPQGRVHLQTYTEGVLMVDDSRWKFDTWTALWTWGRLMANNYQRHGNGEAAAPELLNLARGLQQGLSPEVPSPQPTLF